LSSRLTQLLVRSRRDSLIDGLRIRDGSWRTIVSRPDRCVPPVMIIDSIPAVAADDDLIMAGAAAPLLASGAMPISAANGKTALA
jgi:hypothetical protein